MTNAYEWSVRFKRNAERLESRDRSEVERVIEDLSLRERERRELSQGERRMLERARRLLNEIA